MSNNVEFHDVNQQKTAADFSGKLKFQHLNKNVKLQSSDKKTKVLLSDIKEIIQNGLADIYGNDKDVKYRYIVDLILKRVKSCLNDLSVQSKKDIQTELASVKKEITSDFKDLIKKQNDTTNNNTNIQSTATNNIQTLIIDYLNKYFESKHNDFIGLLSDIQDNINTDVLEKLEDIEDKADIQLKKIQVKDKDKDKKNNLDDIFKSNNNITKYVKSNVNKINNVSRNINKNFGYVNRNINQTNLNISSKISNISTKLKDNLDRSFNFITRSVSTLLDIAISPIKSMFNIITLSLKGIGHGIKNLFKFIFTPAGMYITLMLASIIWKVFKKPITAFYEHHIKPTVDKINEVINDPNKTIFEKIKDSLYILYDDIIVNKLFRQLRKKVFEPFGEWFLGFLYRNRWKIVTALGILWMIKNPLSAIKTAIFGIKLLILPFMPLIRLIFPTKISKIKFTTDTILMRLNVLISKVKAHAIKNKFNNFTNNMPIIGNKRGKFAKAAQFFNRHKKSIAIGTAAAGIATETILLTQLSDTIAPVLQDLNIEPDTETFDSMLDNLDNANFDPEIFNTQNNIANDINTQVNAINTSINKYYDKKFQDKISNKFNNGLILKSSINLKDIGIGSGIIDLTSAGGAEKFKEIFDKYRSKLIPIDIDKYKKDYITDQEKTDFLKISSSNNTVHTASFSMPNNLALPASINSNMVPNSSLNTATIVDLDQQRQNIRKIYIGYDNILKDIIIKIVEQSKYLSITNYKDFYSAAENTLDNILRDEIEFTFDKFKFGMPVDVEKAFKKQIDSHKTNIETLFSYIFKKDKIQAKLDILFNNIYGAKGVDDIYSKLFPNKTDLLNNIDTTFETFITKNFNKKYKDTNDVTSDIYKLLEKSSMEELKDLISVSIIDFESLEDLDKVKKQILHDKLDIIYNKYKNDKNEANKKQAEILGSLIQELKTDIGVTTEALNTAAANMAAENANKLDTKVRSEAEITDWANVFISSNLN